MIDFWNFKSCFYHRLRTIAPLKFILTRELENIRQLLSKLRSETILDIGCGTGHSLEFLNASKMKMGMDKNIRMAKKARKNTRVPVFVADAAFLPIRNHAFGFFSVIGVAEYLKDLQPLFKEMDRTGVAGHYLLVTASPPSLFTTLRRFAGHKIIAGKSFKSDLEKNGYHIHSFKKCYSQIAYLTQKTSG